MQPHIPLRRTLLLAAFAAPWLAGPSAQAASAAAQKIAGVRFEGGAQVAGQELRLNGVGVRAVAWFKGYAAGLYLPQPAATPDEVMAQKGAKRLQMRMLVEVPAEEFVKAFHKGVARNVAAERQPGLAARMASFDAVMRQISVVKVGDVVNLDFLPAQGLQLTLNGAPRGASIPGEDLYAALLLVFLGERPVDAKLKAGLLGARA
jgi:Chalcone isomerase-like